MAKFTPETVKKLEEAFAIDASVPEACFYADISTVTYYAWIKEDPELKEKLNRLKERPVLKARQTINKDLGNTETAKWYLARKKKLEFAERSEVTGADGAQQEIKIIINSDDLDKARDRINNSAVKGDT